MKTHPNLAPYLSMYVELEEDENMCPRCLHPFHKNIFTKRWSTVAGNMHKAGNCPHCGSVLRMTKKGKVK
jgi:RNA polymerase subunit RPABC4/transcription elongation factor Spt4